MQCPNCKFENRKNAKFCGECGYRFEAVCPECGTQNRAENKFCDECGYNFKARKKAAAGILNKESLSLPTTAEKSPVDISPIKSWLFLLLFAVITTLQFFELCFTI